MLKTSRRRFLENLSIQGGVLFGLSAIDAQTFAAQKTADSQPAPGDLVPGKDPRMIVHKTSPCEMETPAALLLEHEHTPAELVFVRNNQHVKELVTVKPPANADEWAIEFDGLIETPRSIRVAELRKLPQVKHDIVVQCSGNGRKYFSEAAHCPGAPWQIGAVANVQFGGVPLSALHEHLKLNIDPRARILTAEGRDAPDKPDAADFEHSVPLRDALETGYLALTMNGQPLPGVHGGPVRLIMPGYYGTMLVKWVSRLRFETSETANHHQVKRYRTPTEPILPGTPFEYALQNSQPNWRMKIKSIIFSPGDGAEVKAGPVEIRGVAFNDGRARLDRVEVSRDGNTWQRADLKLNEDPFGWSTWRAELDLPPGRHRIQCRAIDAWGRTQPLDGQVHWNPSGYAWNGVHRVTIRTV